MHQAPPRWLQRWRLRPQGDSYLLLKTATDDGISVLKPQSPRVVHEECLILPAGEDRFSLLGRERSAQALALFLNQELLRRSGQEDLPLCLLLVALKEVLADKEEPSQSGKAHQRGQVHRRLTATALGTGQAPEMFQRRSPTLPQSWAEPPPSSITA